MASTRYKNIKIKPPGGRQTLTTALTVLTHTAASSADYAIAGLTTTSPFGFVAADEGHTVLAVIANLQARLAQVETVLKAMDICV
jgi:hypothetical protein